MFTNNPGMNEKKYMHDQKKGKPRASPGKPGMSSSMDEGDTPREDRLAPVPVPTVKLVRCDSASSLASVDTIESTTASISGRKRPITGEDSNSSGPEMSEVDVPKKPRGKSIQIMEMDTQDTDSGRYKIRDATVKSVTDSSETKKKLKKLESLRAAEAAALDKRTQLPSSRATKSRALRQKIMEEMAKKPMDDLTSIVGEETEMVEKFAYNANNLKGQTQKALYEAAAKINVVTAIMESRLQSVPGGDALEELRREVAALRKENEELRADLKTAKADIKRLRERTTVRIVDSPERKGRPARRRRIDSDSESEDGMEMDTAEEGVAVNREESAVFPRPLPPSNTGILTPVFRPPLKGVAARNLDDGSLGVPPQTTRAQSNRERPPEALDIRATITAVLKELGLTGRGATSQIQGGEPPTTPNRISEKRKKRKGKQEGKAGQTSGPMAPLLPQVWNTPSSIITAATGQVDDHGRKVTAQAGLNTCPQQVRADTGAQQDETWATVVRRSKAKKGAPQQRAQQTADKGKGAAHTGPIDRMGTGAKATKLGNTPRTPAVTITAPSGQYGTILREARAKIDLAPLGITEIRPRRAITGAMILEIPGDKEGNKADALAGKLTELFAGEESIKITRPYKKAELRIRGLDDSVNTTEIIEALSREGKCSVDQIKLGDIKWSPNGTGTVWVQCPLATAKTVTMQRRLRIGWLSYRVDALPPRRLQCFKCLELGHTSAKCENTEDRSKCCYRCGQEGHKASSCTRSLECPTCRKAGQKSDHKIGTRTCGVLFKKKSKGGRGLDKGSDPGPTTETSTMIGTQQRSLPLSGAEQSLLMEKRTSRNAQGDITPMEVSQEEAIN